MEEIFIDIRDWGNWIKDRFQRKDLVSLEEFLSDYEDLLAEVEHLEDELRDLRQDIEDNYKPIEHKDQYEIYDRDFL